MEYKVIYSASVTKDLAKISPQLRGKILSKIEGYLALDPQRLGEMLTGSFKGYRRYRFGDYRVIYSIESKQIIIRVFRIGHRRYVYASPIEN